MAAVRPSDELAEIAIDGYIYAYPLVLMEITRRVITNVNELGHGFKAPMNQFLHLSSFPDASFTEVVRPNADTLYSSLWYDVSTEPLVINVPDSGGRYYLLPLLDMWTDVFSVPGSRTTGTAAQEFVITGPNWQGQVPINSLHYRSPTATGWMIGRTQTNGKTDYDAVRKFQAGLIAQPLSQHGKSYQPPPGLVNPEWEMSTPPVDQVKALSPVEYFSLFMELTILNPPHPNDYPILDRLRRIGIQPGERFSIANQPQRVQQALNEAKAIALKLISTKFRTLGRIEQGWATNLTGIGTYGTNYLGRATIAYAGLGANLAEDAIYPTMTADRDGRPLSSDDRYVLHFDKTRIPPVHAFWSLTMYDERQLFTANPIDRYAIGDRDALEFNQDGSLDLYIQRDSPGSDREANWLPAPASGAFTMNLRLYWPKTEAINGEWAPPGVERIS